MNARFWVWHRGGLVKLTLRPGQSLGAVTGGPCEEGWSRDITEWTLEGDTVLQEWLTEGRDCDGYLSQSGASECHVDNLAKGGSVERGGPLFPRWRLLSRSQRDQYAEMAGY